MRQHCAQCLTEVLSNGHQTPTGEIVCVSCYSALWGRRMNGDRLASDGRRRPRTPRPKNGRSAWLGPTFELQPSASGPSQGPWRSRD